MKTRNTLGRERKKERGGCEKPPRKKEEVSLRGREGGWG